MWNEAEQHIEMRLRSLTEQRVTIGDLDLKVHFEPGEEWITERSAKFTPDGLKAELTAAGLSADRVWADTDAGFVVVLATAG